MQLQGDAADNPDQRMTEDVELFVDQTLRIGIGFLSSVVTLISFVVILWGLSTAAPLQLFGVDYTIPGYLVWGALIYAVLGTFFTHWIGRPLVAWTSPSSVEADFRFNLVRVRENSEQIALLRGDEAERQHLLGAVRPRGGELAADHDPDQAADGLYRELHRRRWCFRSSWSRPPISPRRCSSAA